MKRSYQNSEFFSRFVDNLPRSMDKEWLWQLFQFEGSVVDAYISYKKRKNIENRFGFVRFKKIEEVRQAIKSLHGMEIKRCSDTCLGG